MRKIILGLLLFIVSCGSGGGGSSSSVTGPSTKGSAPLISNLYYSPSTATLNQGGGAITAYANVDFADEDGDVSTINIYGPDANRVIGTSKIALTGTDGKKTGTIQLIGIISTTARGVLTYEAWVTDSKGNESNKLTATFTIL